MATLFSSGVVGLSSTACCPSVDLGCQTTKGTTDDGKHYSYCYTKGPTKWLQGEADVSKCLTDLHVSQATKCIGTATTKCDLGADVHKAVTAPKVPGNGPLKQDDGNVIKYALQQAVKDGISLKFDDTNWLEVVRTSDNGNDAAMPGASLTFMPKAAHDC
ncbi:MAG: hypothetical protein M1836_008165 [Candelina mexicana]|nr:MAG: hypothetical protein M1836_008165 [Candelina mexicana]